MEGAKIEGVVNVLQTMQVSQIVATVIVDYLGVVIMRRRSGGQGIYMVIVRCLY